MVRVRRVEHAVEAADADEAEARDAEAHDRAAVEGGDERLGLAVGARGLSRADVRVRRALHAEEAGEEREEGARQEAHAGRDAEGRGEGAEDHERVEAEHLVLGHEEGHRTFADVPRDAGHRLVAFGEAGDAEVEDESRHQGEGAHGNGGEGQGLGSEFQHGRVVALRRRRAYKANSALSSRKNAHEAFRPAFPRTPRGRRCAGAAHG